MTNKSLNELDARMVELLDEEIMTKQMMVDDIEQSIENYKARSKELKKTIKRLTTHRNQLQQDNKGSESEND